MKFLLVTYNDTDGVGQTVVGLNSTLNKLGHESKTILLHKSEKSNNDIIQIKRSFFNRVIFFIFEFLKKNSRVLFSFGKSNIKYSSIKNYIDESDVIIIYTLHKFLSFKMLSKIFDTNKIVYLRPLDMELAAGGCHVNFLENGKECNKFQSSCNKCPQLNSLNIFNISNKIFEKKKKIIEKYKPKILLENNFTRRIYNSSPITKNARNETVYLTVNKKRTNLIKKQDGRKILNIDYEDKVILFGTYNLDAPHKGGRILEDILKQNGKIVVCEGGPTLNSKLLTAGLIDEFCLSISPRAVGGETSPLLLEQAVDSPTELSLDRVLFEDEFLFCRYLTIR